MSVYPNLHEGRRHALYLIRSRQVAIEKRRAQAHAAPAASSRACATIVPGDERRDVCWTRVGAAREAGHEGLSARAQPDGVAPRRRRPPAPRAHRQRRRCSTRTVTAALTLAQVALASGDRVGLLAYGRRLQQRVAPARGATHLRAARRRAGARARRRRRGRSRRRGGDGDGRAEAARARRVADRRRRNGGRSRRDRARAATWRRAHVVLFGVDAPAGRWRRWPPPRRRRRPTCSACMAAQETLDRRETLLHGLRQHGALVLEMSPAELSRAASSTATSKSRSGDCCRRSAGRVR